MPLTAKTERNDLALAWAWVLGFTLFRLIYANFFPLAPDEANYWQWSRYLAWGYHDQSPLVGWAIWLSTYFLGNTELAVRLPSVIAIAVASLYLVSMAARWVDSRAAFHTALISQGILALNVGGLLATPDGLQAAAWAAAAYHVARAFENHGWAQWLTSGLWFGVGMLSKYTMVIFLLAVFGYGLFSPLYRRRLASIRPYVGVLIGALMFMPVIIWNASHGWNSLRHVSHLGGSDEAWAIHWEFLGDYLASQAGLLSPIVFLLILMGWGAVILKRYPPGNWIFPFLAYASLPMFAFFALLSLHSRVYGNWPGSGYLTALVLTAALYGGKREMILAKKKKGWGRRLYFWAVGSSYALTALVLLQTVWPLLPLPVSMDRTAIELGGWRELGLKTYGLVQTMPQPRHTFIFGLDYQTASELAFYTPTKPRTVSINRWSRPNVYDYWWQDKDLIGWDAVGVTDDTPSHWGDLKEVFEHVDPPLNLDVFQPSAGPLQARDRKKVKTFCLYRAYGFKGGMRWISPKSGDIRAGS